ncbi:tRNA (cytidine(34)-2'-O)-methyltransferase [Stappia sp.]|uniref:tRNA (cytidine(34)-2'-O)-methyltransferase n=1 Tax=Stappia sp. TaxID=1870903 RepID=UPI0032D97730
MPDLVLYQPDIPQNTGTMLRLGACLGVTVHLIEPAGFPMSDHALRRAGMDYLERAALVRHLGFDAFEDWRRTQGRRLVLLTTRAEKAFSRFSFRADDLLMLGRESVGVPATVHETVDARVTIPMVEGVRSLNVAVSAAMVLGEALRQTGGFAADG